MSSYILYTYRNSLGDISPPIYSHYESLTEAQPLQAYMMISIIWLFWLVNQWINLIILLNVLIALISIAYATLMNEQNILNYEDHSRMNYEARSLKQKLHLNKKVDCLIISQSVQGDL